MTRNSVGSARGSFWQPFVSGELLKKEWYGSIFCEGGKIINTDLGGKEEKIYRIRVKKS